MTDAAQSPAYGIWRETQGGWTTVLAKGLSCNIQLTRKGAVTWTLLMSGTAESTAEAQARLEELAGKIGVGS